MTPDSPKPPQVCGVCHKLIPTDQVLVFMGLIGLGECNCDHPKSEPEAAQPPTDQEGSEENTTENPRSWIAWKRRADAAEAQASKLRAALEQANAILAKLKIPPIIVIQAAPTEEGE